MKKPKPKPKRRQPESWLDYPTEAAPARKRAKPVPIPQERLNMRACLLAARDCMVDLMVTADHILREIDSALK